MALSVKIGGTAGPVKMHARRQSRGGGVTGQEALASAGLEEVEAAAAKFDRQVGGVVTRGHQPAVGFVEETVRGIISCGVTAKAVQHFESQLGGRDVGGDAHVMALSEGLVCTLFSFDALGWQMVAV